MEGRASRERRAWVKEERLVEAAAVADARGHRARGQLVILEGGDWCLKVSSEVLGSGICSIWWDGPGRSRAQRMVWANVLSRKSTLAAAWEPRGKEGRWLVSQSRVYGAKGIRNIEMCFIANFDLTLPVFILRNTIKTFACIVYCQ